MNHSVFWIGDAAKGASSGVLHRSALVQLSPAAGGHRTDAVRRGKQSARAVLTAVLRSASYGLSRMARRIAASERAAKARAIASSDVLVAHTLEIYAEAGAPEGAVYADGLLIGRIEGVRRL